MFFFPLIFLRCLKIKHLKIYKMLKKDSENHLKLILKSALIQSHFQLLGFLGPPELIFRSTNLSWFEIRRWWQLASEDDIFGLEISEISSLVFLRVSWTS